MLVVGAAWILPIEVAQAWAVDRAPPDEFSRSEAFTATTATVWLVRCVAPIVLAGITVVWMRRRSAVPFLGRAWSEFWRVTAPADSGVVVSTIFRMVVFTWMGMAVVHGGLSFQRRLWEWPVYRLHPGRLVLPNISQANRDVIRYIAATTPEGSRILVASDQKLYFLSYYLLPRRVYHVTHPDSEFVIAQADNQRQLAAYRFQDLSADEIDRVKPDYLLRYFEGATFVAGEDLYRDSRWIEHQRRRFGPDWNPVYLVELQRYACSRP